jgi:hypothetical protein
LTLSALKLLLSLIKTADSRSNVQIPLRRYRAVLGPIYRAGTITNPNMYN